MSLFSNSVIANNALRGDYSGFDALQNRSDFIAVIQEAIQPHFDNDALRFSAHVLSSNPQWREEYRIAKLVQNVINNSTAINDDEIKKLFEAACVSNNKAVARLLSSLEQKKKLGVDFVKIAARNGRMDVVEDIFRHHSSFLERLFLGWSRLKHVAALMEGAQKELFELAIQRNDFKLMNELNRMDTIDHKQDVELLFAAASKNDWLGIRKVLIRALKQGTPVEQKKTVLLSVVLACGVLTNADEIKSNISRLLGEDKLLQIVQVLQNIPREKYEGDLDVQLNLLHHVNSLSERDLVTAVKSILKQKKVGNLGLIDLFGNHPELIGGVSAEALKTALNENPEALSSLVSLQHPELDANGAYLKFLKDHFGVDSTHVFDSTQFFHLCRILSILDKSEYHLLMQSEWESLPLIAQFCSCADLLPSANRWQFIQDNLYLAQESISCLRVLLLIPDRQRKIFYDLVRTFNLNVKELEKKLAQTPDKDRFKVALEALFPPTMESLSLLYRDDWLANITSPLEAVVAECKSQGIDFPFAVFQTQSCWVYLNPYSSKVDVKNKLEINFWLSDYIKGQVLELNSEQFVKFKKFLGFHKLFSFVVKTYDSVLMDDVYTAWIDYDGEHYPVKVERRGGENDKTFWERAIKFGKEAIIDYDLQIYRSRVPLETLQTAFKAAPSKPLPAPQVTTKPDDFWKLWDPLDTKNKADFESYIIGLKAGRKDPGFGATYQKALLIIERLNLEAEKIRRNDPSADLNIIGSNLRFLAESGPLCRQGGHVAATNQVYRTLTGDMEGIRQADSLNAFVNALLRDSLFNAVHNVSARSGQGTHAVNFAMLKLTTFGVSIPQDWYNFTDKYLNLGARFWDGSEEMQLKFDAFQNKLSATLVKTAINLLVEKVNDPKFDRKLSTEIVDVLIQALMKNPRYKDKITARDGLIDKSLYHEGKLTHLGAFVFLHERGLFCIPA